MRLLIALLVLILGNNISSFGQNGKGESEMTKSDIQREKVNKAQDRLIFEFFFNNWINKPDNDFKLGWYSRGMNAYFTYDVVLGNSPISLAPGIGLGYNNYYNNSRIIKDSTFSSMTFEKFDDEVNFKKNKLALLYIDFPIELRYRSKPNSKGARYKFAVGFRPGVLIKSHWKYKGDEFRLENNPDASVKFKEMKIPGIEKFRYGVSARAGYGVVNVFATYYISEVFKSGSGYPVNPILVGVSFTGL